MFASCDNSSNSDDESSPASKDDISNPSQPLPDKVGENPIKETIKLMADEFRDHYHLELSPDGTALYFRDDEPANEFNYTYNVDKKEIQMQVKKTEFYDIFGNNGLMTYSEIISYINNYTVEKFKEALKEMYEENKNKEWFKYDYPNCNSYEDYEQAYIKGFNSVKAALEYEIQVAKLVYKAMFGALATYSYEIDSDGKITLTEKFTGVKNILFSRCKFEDESNNAFIYSDGARIERRNEDGKWEYYYGTQDTDEKKIVFKSEDDDKTVTVKYTENISAETVTLKFNNKEYTCKFEGVNFIQE